MTNEARLFEQQAAAFLRDSSDQFLSKVPKGQPGVLAIFQVDESGKQMGYRWLFVDEIQASLNQNSDPMHQWLSDFWLYAKAANRSVEVPMAVISSDGTQCLIAMINLTPEKARRPKIRGFGRRTVNRRKAE